MKITHLLILFLFASTLAQAALPPRVQNEKDLDVMVKFIKDHEVVRATLDSIDVKHHTIYYQNHCQASFGRKHISRPPGWVGPAAPLEFKRATCPID